MSPRKANTPPGYGAFSCPFWQHLGTVRGYAPLEEDDVPFAAAFLRHTLHWTLPGSEVASSSCSWHNETGATSITEAAADALATAAGTLWGSIEDIYDPAIIYIGSTVALVDTDGTIISSMDRAVTPSPGTGSSTTPLPNEVAIVGSLRTSLAGRSYRGRMYFPGPKASGLTAAGRFTTGVCTALADALAAYMQPISVSSMDLEAVVASATAGVFTLVNAAAVGDVPDVQRRRRDALTEVYEVTPV